MTGAPASHGFARYNRPVAHLPRGFVTRATAVAGIAMLGASTAFRDLHPEPWRLGGWLAVTATALVLSAPYALGAVAASRIDAARRVVAASVWPALIAVAIARTAALAPRRLGDGSAFPALACLAVAGLASDGMMLAGAALRTGGAWRRASGWCAAGLATVLVTGASGLAGEAIDRRPVAETPVTRYARALEIFGALRDRYPHWDRAAIAPDAWISSHSVALREAATACDEDAPRCPGLLRVLRGALAELANGHVYAEGEPDLSQPDLEIGVVEGSAVVVWAGDLKDVADGDLVERVDGLPVAAALSRVPAFVRSSSSEHARRRDAHGAILAGPPGTYVQLLVRRADGSLRAVRLLRPAADERAAPAGSGSGEIGYDEDDDGPPIDWDDDGASLPVVYVDHFEGRSFRDDLERALVLVRRAGGAVIDLRECPGGLPGNVEILLDRLVAEPLLIGSFCGMTEGGLYECDPLQIEPVEAPFDGPLAVVVNGGTASAGELAAYGLCLSGRARCFGTATSGDTDLAERSRFDGTPVSLAIAEFRPAAGPSMLGRGLQPDVVVAPTIADVRAGRDPALDAAVAWVRRRLDAPLHRRARRAGGPS